LSEDPDAKQPPRPRDPLPRIFLICGAITLVLLLVILGAIFLDLTHRAGEEPLRPMVPTYEDSAG